MTIARRRPTTERVHLHAAKQKDGEDRKNKTHSRKKSSTLYRILVMGVFLALFKHTAILVRPGDDEQQVPSINGTAVDPSHYNVDDSCLKILLYVEEFTSYGIGCQLNNYVLATIVAMYMNRRLVFMSSSSFWPSSGGSLFGCPTGNVDADASNLPLGLNRLVKIPEWLSGGCSFSDCVEQHDYEYWYNLAGNVGREGNATTCKARDGRHVSILPLTSDGIRYFAMNEFPLKSPDRHERNDSFYVDFYSRLDATPDEIESIITTKGPLSWYNKYLWNDIIALLNRRNMITFQPWIERDVRARMEQVDLPDHYIAVHVRRGDKLRTESKKFVKEYWKTRGYNETTQPNNYIPFSFYMEQVKDVVAIKTVYVATDDPATVKQEIANLTNVKGRTFIMNPDTASSTGHVKQGHDCEERYLKTVAAVTDLEILSKADVFVGEYSSNWGRFVRTLRTTFVNGTGNPRDVRAAFGNWQPPGF